VTGKAAMDSRKIAEVQIAAPQENTLKKHAEVRLKAARRATQPS
jgi:hypothetical protein